MIGGADCQGRCSSQPDLPCDRDASWLVRVAVLLGSGLAVTAGPADVELVASAEPKEMTTDDALQAREIVRIYLDRQVKSARCTGRRSTTVTEVTCRRVLAGQHSAGQSHDRCPIFQAGA